MKVSLIWLIISVVAVVASVPLQIGAYFVGEDFFYLFFILTVSLFSFGITTIPYMVIRIKRLLIIRKILKLGVSGVGYFEGNQRRSNFFVGFTFSFSYRDENDVPRITRTLRGFSEEQIKHLQKMERFKIVFYQKHAVINEDLRGVTQASFSRAALNTGSSRAPQTEREAVAVQKPPVERCRYCGLKLLSSALRCDGCHGPA